MSRTIISISSLVLITMFAPLCPSVSASISQSGSETRERGRQDPRSVPAEPAADDETLQRTMLQLSRHIEQLGKELRLLRMQNERNSMLMEMLLLEERMARLEAKLEDALDFRFTLARREQELNFRMRNIQQEVILRGGLRRDEAEAAIRAEIQRSLEDVRAQQEIYQNRIAELETQVASLRNRVEALRESLDLKDEEEGEEER